MIVVARRRAALQILKHSRGTSGYFAVFRVLVVRLNAPSRASQGREGTGAVDDTRKADNQTRSECPSVLVKLVFFPFRFSVPILFQSLAFRGGSCRLVSSASGCELPLT